MNYKYNEEEYGRVIYENGFQTTFYKHELFVLVKYLKQIKKMNKQETKDEIYSFCKKYIPSYNEVKHYKIIDSSIIKGRQLKNKLIVVKNIDLYESELKYIDSLNIEHELKKLLLAFLLRKKLSHKVSVLINGENQPFSYYFSGSNRKYREIFESANIFGKYKINEMINVLVKNKIIDSVSNNKGDISLEYIKKIQYQKNEKIYKQIKDFQNLGFEFDIYKNANNVKICEECGKYIIRNPKATTKKYCKECAKEIRNKKRIEYNKNYYLRTNQKSL